MSEDWKHFITIGDSQYCGLGGINIWDYQWKSDYKKILVKDPIHGEEKLFHRYWIEAENRKIEFVAGEFYNNIWGIYTRENSDPKKFALNEDQFKIARQVVKKSYLLKKIRNGEPQNDYDFLTTQILSDVLDGKGNKEIIENVYDLLVQVFGKEKMELKIANSDSSITDIANRIRKNVC